MAMRLPARWQSARGAELIEFAIVVPLLLLLLAGIFDFGMMFRSYEAVTNAAREGARVGVLPGYETPDIEARVDEYMSVSGLTGDYTVTVDTMAIETGAGTFNARSVAVNYTYQFAVLGTVGAFFGGDFTTIPLRAVSVMRTEAQAAAAGGG
jgi:Flp pilus assembly protein TadG